MLVAFLPVTAFPRRTAAVRGGGRGGGGLWRMSGGGRRPSRRPSLEDVVNYDGLDDLRVGGFAVPRHLWRRDLRQRGVHRSVEYVVEGLNLDGRDMRSTCEAPAERRGDIVATMRPAVRLVSRLEQREWPVSVSLKEGKIWSYKRDVTTCAIVCVLTSLSMLLTMGFVGSYCGIYAIVSGSMEPTLLKGDAMFVEKVSVRATPLRRGEVVLFRPPRAIALSVQQQSSGGRTSYLVVKRVVGVGGDRVTVDGNGVRVNGIVVGGRVAKSLQPRLLSGTTRLEDGFVYVLGDNGDASYDSRFWGPLPERDVVARPVARIFPVERFRLWTMDDASRARP